MDTPQWLIELKPILVEKIEEAIGEILDRQEIGGGSMESFPWFGDDFSEIMADAAICVLRGMSDSQIYMAKNDLTVDRSHS